MASTSYITVNFNVDLSKMPKNTRFHDKPNCEIVKFVIPNQCLIEIASLGRSSVLDYFNANVFGNVVHVPKSSSSFLNNLIKTAASFKTRQRNTFGRKRTELLKQSTNIHVLTEELSVYSAIERQLEAEISKVHALQEKVKGCMEENKGLSEKGKKQEAKIADLERQKEKLSSYVKNILEMPLNRSKKLSDLGPRQKLRKLKALKSPVEKALEFLKGFGLNVDSLSLSDEDEQKYDISYCIKKACNYDALSEIDQDKIQAILHVMDRFAISDEAYHALSMVIGEGMPRSYIIKQCKHDIDSICKISNTPGTIGAQLDFFEELDRLVDDTYDDGPPEDIIKIRLGGDGTRVSKTVSFLNFSMGLLNTTTSMATATSEEGNRTLAVVKTSENYENIKESLQDLISDINKLQDKRNENNVVQYTTKSGKSVKVQISFGGDMKFLLCILGLNAANATYSCMYCKIRKTDRWITQKSQKFYESIRLRRTLDELKKKVGQYGVIHPPLFDVPLDFVVIDELHLLLRIMDILIANLINEAEQIDKRKRGQNALSSLVFFINTCGVSFKVWQSKGTNKLDYTSLGGNELKKLLKTLPNKLSVSSFNFIHEDTRTEIVNLWKKFSEIYFDYISTKHAEVSNELASTLFRKCCEWIEHFIKIGSKREGYSKSCVTPYMHAMTFHIPNLMLKHSGIKQFTAQGLEKVNDDLKLIYFKRVNKVHAAEQTLRVRFRKSITRKHRRVKRLYTKKNDQYWQNRRLRYGF